MQIQCQYSANTVPRQCQCRVNTAPIQCQCNANTMPNTTPIQCQDSVNTVPIQCQYTDIDFSSLLLSSFYMWGWSRRLWRRLGWWWGISFSGLVSLFLFSISEIVSFPSSPSFVCFLCFLPNCWVSTFPHGLIERLAIFSRSVCRWCKVSRN